MISNGMRLAVIAFMVTPLACLCVGQDGPKAVPTDQVSLSTSRAPTGGKEEPEHPPTQTRDPRYQLHPGDSLAIIFPLTPEFNQPTVAVQPDGFVTLQGLEESSLLQAKPCRNSGIYFKRRTQRL